MTLGFIMYFYYGITHSTLEQTSDEIELHVDRDYVRALELDEAEKEILLLF